MKGPHGPVFLVLIGVLLSPAVATAQVRLFPGEFQRSDVIAIERDGRDLFGFDSVSGGRAEIRLEVGEAVYFEKTSGRVGLVLTSRRALAIGPGTGFQEIRYQSSETRPEKGLIEDEIALVATSKRVLGFIGNGGAWAEERLSPSESVEALRVGGAVGVVATNRRGLGLGTRQRSFVAIDLRVKETLESVSAQDTLATLRTSKRILVFGALRGGWSVQDRSIR